MLCGWPRSLTEFLKEVYFRMRYVIGGNVMLDSVRFAGEKEYSRESIGGPATFAYSGVKLFTDDVMQCSRLGEDYHELFDDWVARNGVETKGFKVVSARCNHSYLVYNADGTYGSEKFMQSVAQMGEWMQNLGYMKTSPQDFAQFTGKDTKGIYLAQNYDRVFWDQLGAVKARDGFKIMWEIEGPSAHKEFLDQVIYDCRYVDIFSINIQEAQNLFEVEGDEACIRELQKLPVDVTLFRVGERGLYSVTPDAVYYLPPAPGPVVDPTGCGNTSTGGALYAYAEGYDPLMVGIMANVASGQNIRQYGVIQDFAKARREAQEQVQELYAKYKEQYGL